MKGLAIILNLASFIWTVSGSALLIGVIVAALYGEITITHKTSVEKKTVACIEESVNGS